jgi:hypothetical protein
MITAATRLCHACHAVLPDPAPPACPACDTVTLADHTEWDPRVRYFLAAAFLSKHALGAGRHQQTAWEDVLRMIAQSGGAHANPFLLRWSSPAIDCYPIAVKLAVHWRSTGAPMVPDLLEMVGRGAGLIAPGFPQRRAS